MKAIVLTQYGNPDMLKLKDIEKPTPKDNEVLVRVRASSVNYGDLLARNFKDVTPQVINMPWLFWLLAKAYFGFSTPKVTILGNEFAGQVEAVGKDVTSFKTGDQVFGHAGQSMGVYAEYFCIPQSGTIALKPANMTYEQAAVVPYGAVMALPILKNANIQPGQKVLILGASGAIGSAAVQIAKHFGAEVTGVCGTQRVEFVKALGADRVIDYTKADFTQNSERYDLIFDVLGRGSFDKTKNVLKPNGVHLYASFKMKQVFQMLLTSRASKKVVCGLASGNAQDLAGVKELIETGKIKGLVDRTYPLEQVAEAHRYVEAGDRKGNIAIIVG